MENKAFTQGLLVGEKGVGKTFAMDVSARLMAGLGENTKFNQLIDVRTLLHKAAYTTLPITLEDNESKKKVCMAYGRGAATLT